MVQQWSTNFVPDHNLEHVQHRSPGDTRAMRSDLSVLRLRLQQYTKIPTIGLDPCVPFEHAGHGVANANQKTAHDVPFTKRLYYSATLVVSVIRSTPNKLQNQLQPTIHKRLEVYRTSTPPASSDDASFLYSPLSPTAILHVSSCREEQPGSCRCRREVVSSERPG